MSSITGEYDLLDACGEWEQACKDWLRALCPERELTHDLRIAIRDRRPPAAIAALRVRLDAATLAAATATATAKGMAASVTLNGYAGWPANADEEFWNALQQGRAETLRRLATRTP